MKTSGTAAQLPVGGMWIAFLGPDGVGKSAVIDRLRPVYGTHMSHPRCFHFRPHFRTQGVNGAPVLQPHAEAPRCLFISLCKLVYWLADCWAGYLFTIRRVKRRSGVVLFDRYYPDVLVDPLRYRLPVKSLQFARWLTAFFPRPDLYVLLDAPAEVVQCRKAELTPEEAERQRTAYLQLFHEFRCKLIVNAECPVDQVAQQVTTALSPDVLQLVRLFEPLPCRPLI